MSQKMIDNITQQKKITFTHCRGHIQHRPTFQLVSLMGQYAIYYAALSVTRLGDLLDFGHLFKAFGNN